VGIHLGFEVKTGKPVEMKLHHLVITGMTGESGKTTTLEALLTRGKLTGLVFRTKRGELGFDSGYEIPPFFSEEGLTQWRALEGLLSATLQEKVNREPGVRGALIRLSSGTTSLDEVYRRNKVQLNAAKGFMRDVHEKIKAYLDLVLPQLKNLRLSDRMELKPNVLNVMNLEGLSDEIQNLVIFASTEYIHHNCKDVILVIPEAPKFIPQDRGSPCKVAIERYVREGRAIGNYLWIDSQDLRGVDKRYLRHCDNWILGRQRFMLEVESTLDAIPLEKNKKPKPEEIQQLEIGHFIACLHNDVKRVYVQPVWLTSDVAKEIAMGHYPFKELPRAPKQFIPTVAPPPDPNLSILPPPLTFDDTPPEEPTILRMARENAEGKLSGTDPLTRIANLLASQEKRLDDLEAQHRGSTPHISMAHSETVYEVKHEAHTETLYTKTGLGQIMYVILNDLAGKPAGFSDIMDAMREQGWNPNPNTVAPNLLGLLKKGLLIKEGETKTTKYRPPGKVRIKVVKE